MTFYSTLSAHFTLAQQLELVLRILVAALCGGLIGIERSRRFKDAGVRTHALVSCAAALLMVLSKYGFLDMLDLQNGMSGARTADPSRIAAQVVSGIGFLGAGVIYRDRKFVTRGLTTAAGIWAVAGVGMTNGAGMYYIGFLSVGIIFLVQIISRRFATGADKYYRASLEVTMKNQEGGFAALQQRLTDASIRVSESYFTHSPDDEIHCELTLHSPDHQQILTVVKQLLQDPNLVYVQLHEDE